ncbi:hypothetical protein TVAG_268410 [Trichomonas vaginalis G3]|uniref:Uncharacterized protein n=1 Tax=Trichomonas vaginalis (strain ATCC PRA-98 / G3) TaxID=412133 RepID=A2DLJ0_TRIV3|nr:hypothetical protein TVAGG3_0013230 [Trichomonas vaginalis G3]EAY18808.1 hypothetical protein TVAG_268410 [Trichomonas vaginalis G3]KAI5539253.1 hypothetical protein TVAGG3_0013230 [Trichomonas vaginalis G3]|eukprot:XP_001579794.1 hypothetical protein [Trichomonas vaginalis G3]
MNFFQQIGLWFTSLKFPEGFERAFQKFMDFVSLIWTFISSITDLEIFYIWSCIEVTLFVIWLIIKIWDPVLELKGPNSSGWEKRGKLFYWVVYLMVEILVVLFLPCITACFNVIFCYEGLMVPYELECYHGMHWLHLCIAIFVFLFIGLYLPFQIFFVIRTYQPKPHQYDSSGQKLVKGFDDEEITRNYQDLLERDQCPYKFLYAGYEYGWSLYKVITMIFKMVIIIPTIPFFTSTVGTASASLVIVTIYGLISIISSPFLLPSDD